MKTIISTFDIYHVDNTPHELITVVEKIGLCVVNSY